MSDLARRLRLIVITDRALAERHGGVESVVAEALDAGCRAVQLRMKDAGARETARAAEPLRRMTRDAGALFFVNDRLDVALATGADGVHLGPDDLPVEAARRAVRGVTRDGGRWSMKADSTGTPKRSGSASEATSQAERGSTRADRATSHAPPRFLIGYSTDDPEEARRAVAEGADYIGCGTVYPTGSKTDAGEVIGLDGLDAVARAVNVPVVGVGGITPERAAEVARTAAAGTAVISAVMGGGDPGVAVRALLRPFRRPG